MASSEVFTKDDISNTLRSALLMAYAKEATATPHNAAYRRGYMAAIAIVAVSLGIQVKDVTSVLEGNA